MHSLTDLLPFVGLGILDKTDTSAQNDNITEEQAFFNAAIRVVKAESHPIHEDIPFDSTEKQQVEIYFDRLKQSDVPVMQEDTAWTETKSKCRTLLLQYLKAGQGSNLSDFLDFQKLLTNYDEIDNDAEQITLMTLHAAKGTEFPVVIIIGMEEGSFPMWRQDITEAELEEERRLFYVGMTRAQDQLYLSSTIYRSGDRERSTSMFIREMPNDYMVKWSPSPGL